MKFAVVKIGGHQYIAKEGDNILIDKIKEFEQKKELELKDILLVKDNGKIYIGKPLLKNFKIKAKNLGIEKGKKIIVFKMKPKKRYKKKQGHRQKHLKIKIEKIIKLDYKK